MPSKSKSNVTTDHEEIRRWVEERGGHPAAVKSTRGGRGKGDRTGILRIDFPGYSGAGSLEEISWEEFFEKFDKEKLAFLCQEQTADGQKSNFNKLVQRGAAKKRASGGSSARKTASARKTSAGKSPRPRGRATAKRATAKKQSPRKSTKQAKGRKSGQRGSGRRSRASR
jgi:hypothetical protein